jgi:hypothetical protein
MEDTNQRQHCDHRVDLAIADPQTEVVFRPDDAARIGFRINTPDDLNNCPDHKRNAERCHNGNDFRPFPKVIVKHLIDANGHGGSCDNSDRQCCER